MGRPHLSRCSLLLLLLTFVTTVCKDTQGDRHDHPHSRHLEEPSQPCQHGTQPGYWNVTGTVGRKWMSIDPHCPLHNYIQAALRPSGSAPLRPIRIYFISDSLELRKLQDYQAEYSAAAHLGNVTLQQTHSLGTKTYPWPSGSSHYVTPFDHLFVSRTSKFLHPVMRYMPGVHPDGPYNGKTSPDLSWKNTLGPDLKKFSSWLNGPPDLVVMGSNLWDLARIYTHEHHWWADYNEQGVPEMLVRGYMTNLTDATTMTRSKLPKGTPIFLRTTPFPRFNYTSGICERTHLLNLQWISTLNSAAKVVAKKLGLHVLDEGAMLSHFSPSFTIRDQHHPKPWCNMETLNVLFNMLATLRPELFERWLQPEDVTQSFPWAPSEASLSAEDASSAVLPEAARG